MRKSALIRDLRAELAARNRDIWRQSDVIADLRLQVRVLEAVAVEQEAELAALKARRCETCAHAGAKGRYSDCPTFKEDGYALCGKVVFNPEPFWDYKTDADGRFVYTPGTRSLIRFGTEPPVAWVVDGSDYWAALHVTPDFCCSEWTLP